MKTGHGIRICFKSVIYYIKFRCLLGSLILLWGVSVTDAQNTDFYSALKKFDEDSVAQFYNEPPDTDVFLKEYDFIIVGAGTAGCVLANRLTEVPGWTVLLIEAGDRENFFMDIPFTALNLQLTPVDWQYKTEPSNEYCTGLQNKQCNWPRGKVVGGSSVLNYMVYTRTAAQNFDHWAALGNTGWSWADVLPYFKKFENFDIYYSSEDARYHNYDGYQHIEFSPFRTPTSKVWVKAAQEYGFKYGDYNGPYSSGVVSFMQGFLYNGTRDSTSRAYLHPIYKRKNLYVTKRSFVTKLLFDETDTRAVAVEFEKDGKKYVIRAAKEVIISAGTVNSAQLLMLSGIGPKEHLDRMSIPVIKDLHVGYNLMDHAGAAGMIFIVNENPPDPITGSYISSHLEVVFQWMQYHSGPLSTLAGSEAIVFTKLGDEFNTTAWPDIELAFLGADFNNLPGSVQKFNFNETIFQDTYGSEGLSNAFMVFPINLLPKSRGSISLRSRNPRVHPVIKPNYFDVDEDLEKLVEGMKLSVKIAEQLSLEKIGAKFYPVPIKECLECGSFGSDDYFACQARLFTLTIYHPCGTCKMGPEGDATAVVDPELLVRGMKNLRVVDASVIPVIPSGHINAPVLMIAEKAADIIKKTWVKLS